MNTSQIYGEELNDNFHQAVKNAQNLVYYAANNGIEIDEKDLKNIIAAKKFKDSEMIDPAVEVAFWNSLKDLSKSVQPVSIESIHSIFERKIVVEDEITEKSLKGLWLRTKKFFRGYSLKSASPAKRITGRLRGFALLSMLVMLFLQIYWVIGVALINDSHNMLELAEKKNNELVALEDSLGEKAADSNEVLKLETEIQNLKEELEVRSKVLIKWNYLWKRFPWILKKKANSDKAQEEMSTVFKTNLVQAKFAIEALYSYFLPLLYGLLGAFVFILRKLAAEIKSLTYTKESNINYGLRLHLGALAGLAIGWFATPENSTSWTFSSLSPLAIAFLAGYSVELLFTIMDRLINPTIDTTMSRTQK